MGCPSCWRIVNVTVPAPTYPLHLRISAYLISWFRPPRLDADADYQAAKEWARLYSPTGREENGEVLLQFSKDHYTLVSSMLGELDKKADDLMRTTLAVFGAVLAAVSRTSFRSPSLGSGSQSLASPPSPSESGSRQWRGSRLS